MIPTQDNSWNDAPEMDAATLLAWQVDMGAVETHADEALDRFEAVQEAPVQPVSQPAATAGPAPDYKAAAPKPVAPRPVQASAGAGAQKAGEAAASANTLEELRTALEDFDGGHIKRTAKNTVFADGTPGAPLMIIGGSPETEDDMSGRPFSGRSGNLLDQMLKHAGLDREKDVYLTQMIPWRLPGIRKPDPAVIDMCRPFALRHIELAKPSVLLVLGGVAGAGLTAQEKGISQLRGRWHDLKAGDQNIAAMVTYSPSYLIQHQTARGNAWRDLLQLVERIKTSNE